MMNKQDKSHANLDRDTETDSSFSASLFTSDCHPTDAGDHCGSLLEAVDPSFYDDGWHDDDVDLGASNDDLACSQDTSQASVDSQKYNFSLLEEQRGQKTLKRRPIGRKRLLSITENDYEPGAERSAFQLINHHAATLLDAKSKGHDRNQSLIFFFGDELSSPTPSFSLCCQCLGVRPHVIQLRIQFEFWRVGTSFNGPWYFSHDQLPLADEICFHAGFGALVICDEIWRQPGILEDELVFAVNQVSKTSSQKIFEAIAELEKNFLLSKNLGWYFTGRNPVRKTIETREGLLGPTTLRSSTIHWAGLF